MMEIDGITNKAEILLKQPYARIVLPESDGSFRGEIMEFPGCLAVGETAAEALENLESIAKDWIMDALDRGQNIPNPIEASNDFSGRLVLRLPKSLHKKATWVAEREGVSLNQFMVHCVSEIVGEKKAHRPSQTVNLHSFTQTQNVLVMGGTAQAQATTFATNTWKQVSNRTGIEHV